MSNRVVLERINREADIVEPETSEVRILEMGDNKQRRNLFNLGQAKKFMQMTLHARSSKELIEAEKENLRQQIARYNDNLANHAGFVERLMRQIKNLEKQGKFERVEDFPFEGYQMLAATPRPD